MYDRKHSQDFKLVDTIKKDFELQFHLHQAETFSCAFCLLCSIVCANFMILSTVECKHVKGCVMISKGRLYIKKLVAYVKS